MNEWFRMDYDCVIANDLFELFFFFDSSKQLMAKIIKKLKRSFLSHMLIYQMWQKQSNYHPHFQSWRNAILRSLLKTIWICTRKVCFERNHRYAICLVGHRIRSVGPCWLCHVTRPPRKWQPKCSNWYKSIWVIGRHVTAWVWIRLQWT